MKNKFSFREPLGKDLNGLYITAAQMQFFLNRRDGGKLFILGDPQFFQYFYKCAVYNIVWDLTQEDSSCATFFWDENESSVGLKFPSDGKVVRELKKKKVSYLIEGDGDELY